MGEVSDWDFFVSYTKADRSWAEWIAWILEEDGYRVLVQAWDFVPGTNWTQHMHDGTARAARTVAVLSDDYLESVYGGAEWHAAWRQDPTGAERRLIPVRVADCDRPGLLGAVVGIDLFGRAEEEAREALRSGVATATSGRGKPQSKPGFPDTGRAISTAAQFPGAVVVGEIPRQPHGFVDRAVVRRLAEALDEPGVAVVCALTGLRGVGKTQVAAAYARSRVVAGDGLVGWVNAESRDDLVTGLARIAARVGVADPDGDSLKSAQRLREHLETRPGSGLVVFDNAVDPDTLLEFLPAVGATRVVITSTDRAFTEFGREVDVAAFSRAESRAYLRGRTGVDDEVGAAAVAAELGDLPVALAQAAATIAGQRLTYPRYLKRLRAVPVAEVLGRAAGQSYRQATAAALLLSIETTETEDPTGVTGELLRVVSVLSPQGVRRDLLDTLDVPDMKDSDGGAVDAALQRCVRRSLLSWSVSADSVIMHRLVGRVLRERDRASRGWSSTLATVLGLLEPHLFDESRAWGQRDLGSELVSQIEALWEVTAVEPPDDPDILARELRARSWGVRQLQAAADLTRAIELGLRVAADSERVLGADHPDTLASRSNLAYAYWSVGRLEEAIALFERTLTDSERVLGADHPDTLASRNNLAAAYQSAGRLAEAIALFERTLTDRERVLGADHPSTPGLPQQPRRRLWSARRLAEAIALFERTLTDRERVLGADHPDTLTSALTSPPPTCRWGAGRRRSRCSSGPSPTASGSWAPTTPTPWPPATSSPPPTSRWGAWEAIPLYEQGGDLPSERVGV